MAMKRRRQPTQKGNTDEKIQLSGASINDLPMTILVDILLKLSTRSIMLCKCVCKTWHNIIADPQFAKLHLAQANACLLIRDVHPRSISSAVYFLEPEDGYCWCGSNETKCDRCRLNIKVKAKLKIPFTNTQVLFSHVSNNDANEIVHTKSTRKTAHLIELNSSTIVHMYKIVNSCNGLLCLATPLGSKHHSIVVCNPITGEFIYVPGSYYDGTDASDIRVGLGFSPKNNQYKVIRMFSQRTKDYERVEIHTLGTDTWRSVDISNFKIILGQYCLTYHNGAIHWLLRQNNKGSHYIVSFDLDEERFHSHHVPSPPCAKRKCHYLTMGVLGGYLCLYNAFACHHTCIWAMKNYGSWTKLFSIDIGEDQCSLGGPTCRPIVYLRNGAFLMFRSDENKFIYFDQLGGLRFKYLKCRGVTSEFEAIAHTPSFVSLKDTVKTDNVEIFNVNSR